MYHIKNDKRCRKSAELISAALEELLKKKQYMDITVSDIHKTSGVGRSTFYRLFDNIDDVVAYNVDEQFREMLRDYSQLNMRDFTTACLEALTDSGSALTDMISSGRVDLITRSLRRNLHETAGKSGQETELQYGFAVFSSVCMAVVRVWDENGRKESKEELTDLVERYLNFSVLSRR